MIDIQHSVMVAALVSALSAGACSSPSPAAPGESTPSGGPQSARDPTVQPGVYDLSFRAFVSGGLQEVFSLRSSSSAAVRAGHGKLSVLFGHHCFFALGFTANPITIRRDTDVDPAMTLLRAE
jgi:hypothetical protein